jgi:hypothetical protein
MLQMKKFSNLIFKVAFSFFLVLSCNSKSWAQEVELIDLSAKSDNTVSVETQAEFPNGLTDFYVFYAQNYKIPEIAYEKKVDGKYYIHFIIEKDGSLSNIKIVKDLGYGLGAEAIRVMKLSPKWIPATKDGEPVSSKFILPMVIQLARPLGR